MSLDHLAYEHAKAEENTKGNPTRVQPRTFGFDGWVYILRKLGVNMVPHSEYLPKTIFLKLAKTPWQPTFAHLGCFLYSAGPRKLGRVLRENCPFGLLSSPTR